MGKLIEVKIGEHRNIVKCDLNDIACQRNDVMIIEVARGSEHGRIISEPEKACEGKTESAYGKLLRVATEGDLKQIENNRLKSQDAMSICERKINEQRLDMRVAKAEYTFDNSKIIFFFTAEGRVDFRNLVKELAKIFRVRIELKQIGVRDKAQIVGGYGVCGRELCCTSFLRDFNVVRSKMAKEQGLPINPTKTAGLCGKLKCCMAYEYQVYKEFARSLPKIGQKVTTPEGNGKVVSVNILRKIVSVELEEGKYTKVNYAESQTN